MPRMIEVDGALWEVSTTGRVTQYQRDEFGLRFRRRGGDEVRIVRYAPTSSRHVDAALAEMPDYQLRELFGFSQPGRTAPETGYLR
ncbi:MAG: hypothetical protein OEW80_11270 [Gemmatimonadota bacterium]|nr:hypothetical protein [Gemmatimonadota bacterium]